MKIKEPNMHSANIVSIICRSIIILGVLAFTLFLTLYTVNFNFLWFLLLILVVEFIPTYEQKVTYKEDKKNGANTVRNTSSK